MAFFRKLFQSGGKSKKKDYPNIIQGVDPLESWQKVGELGDGAFGKVFKTEHIESGKLAAMKRVPIQDDLELDDFMVEIDILAECKHHNIVGLHEAYFYDQALWIYIEFCAGGAVDDIIVELDHGLSEPQIQCIARQLLEALLFLHSSHCIHRDLKAGNILLCPDGSIRLADFGVSAKDSMKGKQKHDTFIGTPYWMAPEVVVCETIKDDPYDSSADIWSAGITFIELADMNPPYHEMSPMRVLQKIVKKDPPILAVPSRWSRDFNDIIAKCLVKDPSCRATAGSLLEHPFVATTINSRPLRILYQEVKSEVQEIVEELPEDADLSADPEHSQQLLSELPSPVTTPTTLEPLPKDRIPSATPPPRDPTPAPRDPTPASRDPTPAPRDPTPTSRDPTPASRDPTPASRDPTPASRDSTPSSRAPTATPSPEHVEEPADTPSDIGPGAVAVEDLTPEDIGPSAGVITPPPSDIGSSAGVITPPPSDIGPSAGVITPPPSDTGPGPVAMESTPSDLGPQEVVIRRSSPAQESPAADRVQSPIYATIDKSHVDPSDVGREEITISTAPRQPSPTEIAPVISPTSDRVQSPIYATIDKSHVPKSGHSSDQESLKSNSRADRTRQDDESSLGSEVSAADDRANKKDEHKYATLSRVRKFKVDGQVMETTTRKIVDVTANKTLRDNRKYQQMRKQDFRELKQLQREEMKEATEFYGKIKVDRETQDRKFDIETGEIERRYDAELELISKRQKKEIIRQESQHIQQFKSRLKAIKSQQSKDLKKFKDSLKEEEKATLKRIAKSQRKDAVNRTKLELQSKRTEKEATFTTQQVQNLEGEVKLVLNEQKNERKSLELSFLDARQDLRRNHTSLMWEMEQRQKQDRHQLLKQQLREAFHMQRHQMHIRHQTEVELQGRRNTFQLEELRQKQTLEKRQLPKQLKADHKQKVAEVRKAIRNKRAEKESLKKLDEQYVKLCQLETELMNERHEKEMDTVKTELEANMRELQEIQNEKKMQLTQQETNKVKERDEQHTVELREWRVEIAKLKQKLEEEFRASREEQEQFYSLDRPIPKQLRQSLSLPDGSVSRDDRALKALSTSSLDPTEVGGASRKSRPPLQSLDEVVMGTPILNHTPPPTSDNGATALGNGNST